MKEGEADKSILAGGSERAKEGGWWFGGGGGMNMAVDTSTPSLLIL